nr:hypothetical protein [Tanacetum cinerariifolium]
MGSSWSSGGVVRSGEEAVVGLAGENGVNSAGLNVGGRQESPLNVIWLISQKVPQQYSFECVAEMAPGVAV